MTDLEAPSFTHARRPYWMCLRLALGAGLLGVGLLGGAGCARAAAKTNPDGPPLAMPLPPPRVIGPSDEPLVSAPAEPSEPAPAPASTTRRPVRRPANASEQTPRSEPVPPPVEPQLPQAVPTEQAPAPAAPAPTLRAPGSAEKPIRDRLAVAQRDLSRVDYAKLSEDGRVQYEQSKRFMQQAEQALKDQNFVFAQTLADKAANIAAQLAGG